MPKVNCTIALRCEYDALFNACTVRADRQAKVTQIANAIMQHKSRYDAVAAKTGVPWFFVAVVHNMESDMSFTRHLHNGDPLSARTVQVPKGYPRTGSPPFAWEVSAVDALTLRSLSGRNDWSLAGTLYQLEGYNGWGYRLFHPHVLTPYLWSGSMQYSSGKYVADGRWSDTAVSSQNGAAVVLRRLAELAHIEFVDQPAPPANASPLVVRYSSVRPTDSAKAQMAEVLQQWLNTFPGVFVKIDGAPGEKTSNAYKVVTGSFLPGDPRTTA